MYMSIASLKDTLLIHHMKHIVRQSDDISLHALFPYFACYEFNKITQTLVSLRHFYNLCLHNLCHNLDM